MARAKKTTIKTRLLWWLLIVTHLSTLYLGTQFSTFRCNTTKIVMEALLD